MGNLRHYTMLIRQLSHIVFAQLAMSGRMTIKTHPQKPEPIVIQQINEHLNPIGAIHYTQPELYPG